MELYKVEIQQSEHYLSLNHQGEHISEMWFLHVNYECEREVDIVLLCTYNSS